MATIRQEAQAYEPPQTLNVADLEQVPVDAELHKGQGKDKEGKDFEYRYIKVNDKEYRVPGSVIGGIKALIQRFPQLKYVQVLKEGEKMNTRYQVIPYYPPSGVIQEEPTAPPQLAQQARVGQRTIRPQQGD